MRDSDSVRLRIFHLFGAKPRNSLAASWQRRGSVNRDWRFIASVPKARTHNHQSAVNCGIVRCDPNSHDPDPNSHDPLKHPDRRRAEAALWRAAKAEGRVAMNRKLPDAPSGASTRWATERIASLMEFWRHRSEINGRNDRFEWCHGGRVFIIQIALATVSLNWRGTLFEPGRWGSPVPKRAWRLKMVESRERTAIERTAINR